MPQSTSVQPYSSVSSSRTADGSVFYSVAESARLLGVSRSTVWRWIEAGELPASRVGPKNIRIRRQDLQDIVRPARHRKEVTTMAKETLHIIPPTAQEIARRQALVKEIKVKRAQRVISPLTSADLVRK